MKPWQQTHFILTAASVPVAILVCWLVYKKTSGKKETKCDSDDTAMKFEKSSTKELSSNKIEQIDNKTSDVENEHLSSSLLDAVSSDSSAKEDEVLASPEISSQTAEAPIPATEDEYLQPEVNSTSISSAEESGGSHGETVCENLVKSEESEITSAAAVLDTKKLEKEPEVQVADVCSNDMMSHNDDSQIVEMSDKPKEVVLEQTDASSYDDKSLSSLESDEIQQTSEDEVKSSSEVCIEQTEVEDIEVAAEKSDHQGVDVAMLTNLTNWSGNGEVGSSDTDGDSSSEHEFEVKSCSLVGNKHSNANNNNSTENKLTNGQRCSPSQKGTCGGGESNKYCESCGHCGDVNSTRKSPVSRNGQNGLDDSHSNKTDSDEPTQDGGGEKSLSKRRPNSLPKLDCQRNGESTIQVHVEFPSEKVGLLIGKQGRNIKQLKQDSGADVFVHAAKFRDDIQVLQICGTQSDIESCVGRIKRRFNDVTLSPIDPSNICTSPPSSSGVSPNPNTPPPLLYSMPNIAQLRIPEGHTVDVLVSAIASVDCIFLQQYTHPSYQLLDNLERAMSLCYAEPTTPCLPKPVQAGLICAAPQDGMWYRSQVMQNYDDSDQILIKFMDYGGYATVSYKTIKQIRADFVTLPFQAIECYLDNIAPPEDKQACEETVAKIAEILKEGRYQVRVTGCRSDGHPKVHLYKCHNNEVMLINQAIATKGLATWVEPAPYN